MSEMHTSRLLISCEHGGYAVPEAHQKLFANPLGQRLLRSHRGWDPGALEVAELLSQNLQAPLYAARISRLVIELNRARNSPELFSRFTSRLSAEQKRELLALHYEPFRSAVEQHLRALSRRGVAVHVSVHTFTPRYQKAWRKLELGVLFDPARAAETAFADRWIESLKRRLPNYRIAANEPYQGSADGHTTDLRARFSENRYFGIELEVNQRLLESGRRGRRRLLEVLSESLRQQMQLPLPN